MLLVGFPVHEFCHAFAAYRLGDSTARWQGRLTLDPRVHFDPVGGLHAGHLGHHQQRPFFFGYAKPTPVNPMNLQGGRHGEALVAAAGPLSNLVMAAIVAIPLRLLYGSLDVQQTSHQRVAARGARERRRSTSCSSTSSCSSSTCCRCRRWTAGRCSAAWCRPRCRGRCATWSGSTRRSSRSSSWRVIVFAAARIIGPIADFVLSILLGPQYSCRSSADRGHVVGRQDAPGRRRHLFGRVTPAERAEPGRLAHARPAVPVRPDASRRPATRPGCGGRAPRRRPRGAGPAARGPVPRRVQGSPDAALAPGRLVARRALRRVGLERLPARCPASGRRSTGSAPIPPTRRCWRSRRAARAPRRS